MQLWKQRSDGLEVGLVARHGDRCLARLTARRDVVGLQADEAVGLQVEGYGTYVGEYKRNLCGGQIGIPSA